MLSCCWRLHSIISAVPKMFPEAWRYGQVFLFWHVELVPRFRPRLSVTLCIRALTPQRQIPSFVPSQTWILTIPGRSQQNAQWIWRGNSLPCTASLELLPALYTCHAQFRGQVWNHGLYVVRGLLFLPIFPPHCVFREFLELWKPSDIMFTPSWNFTFIPETSEDTTKILSQNSFQR
jgi:hypothetical protein